MMPRFSGSIPALFIIVSVSLAFTGCGGAGTTANVNTGNSNTTFASNGNFNTNVSNTNTAGANLEFAEPQTYQGVIKMTLQTIAQPNANAQSQSTPPLTALVAREGANRAMEFTLPTNEKVIYLEKGNMKYIVLPTRKQYAELTAEALGFEVRSMMMPAEIVNRLKTLPGVRQAGEENLNGRTVVKYVYGNTTNTGTQAGTVATESYFLIDKETNLPVRSETVSQSASGGNVQGVSGVRLLTEMTDIKTQPDAGRFDVPADFQRIDPEQVKAQANILFQAAAAIIGQMINQAKVSPTPAAAASPTPNQ